MKHILGFSRGKWNRNIERYIRGTPEDILRFYFKLMKFQVSSIPKDELAWTCAGEFSNSIRNKTKYPGSFQKINILQVDLESKKIIEKKNKDGTIRVASGVIPMVENADEILDRIPFCSFFVESPSSQPTDRRYRLYIFLDSDITDEKLFSLNYEKNVEVILGDSSIYNNIDRSVKDVTRLMYISRQDKVDTLTCHLKRPLYSFKIFRKPEKDPTEVTSGISEDRYISSSRERKGKKIRITAGYTDDRLTDIFLNYVSSISVTGGRHQKLLYLSNLACFYGIPQETTESILQSAARGWGIGDRWEVDKQCVEYCYNNFNPKYIPDTAIKIKQTFSKEQK